MKSIFPKTPTTDFEKFVFMRAFCKTQSRLIKMQNQELTETKATNKRLKNKVNRLVKKQNKQN